VLQSNVSDIRPDGPAYRGRDFSRLAGKDFESVAEWLWTKSPRAAAWPEARIVLPLQGDSAQRALLFALASQAASELPSLRQEAREIARVRESILALCDVLRRFFGGVRAAPNASVAECLAAAFGNRTPSAVRAINAALVACADHELNVSTFVVRITASARADLFACLTAAMAVMTGAEHGGTAERVEAFIDEVGSAKNAAAYIGARLKRGEVIVGFGHTLYPRGDPRATHLFELAHTHRPVSPRLRTIDAIVSAVHAFGGEPPAVDLALAALASAFVWPRGAAGALFAIGRIAGWTAHVLEQRQSGELLRPRAKFVER
jgi:citrate synthase